MLSATSVHRSIRPLPDPPGRSAFSTTRYILEWKRAILQASFFSSLGPDGAVPVGVGPPFVQRSWGAEWESLAMKELTKRILPAFLDCSEESWPQVFPHMHESARATLRNDPMVYWCQLKWACAAAELGKLERFFWVLCAACKCRTEGKSPPRPCWGPPGLS